MDANVEVVLTTFEEMGIQRFPDGEALPSKPPLWSDSSFDVIHFTGSNLPFSKKFPGDYKAIKAKPFSTLIDMKENILLRELMLERFDQKRRDGVKKELREKLKKYEDGYS